MINEDLYSFTSHFKVKPIKMFMTGVLFTDCGALNPYDSQSSTVLTCASKRVLRQRYETPAVDLFRFISVSGGLQYISIGLDFYDRQTTAINISPKPNIRNGYQSFLAQ